MGRYVPMGNDQRAMLDELGLGHRSAVWDIPEVHKGELNLPEPLSEMELSAYAR